MTEETHQDSLMIGGFPWLRADTFKEGYQVTVSFEAVELKHMKDKDCPVFNVWVGNEMFALSGWSLITGVRMHVQDFIGKKAVLTSTTKKWIVKFI